MISKNCRPHAWVGIGATMGLHVRIIKATVISLEAILHVCREVFNCRRHFFTVGEVDLIEGETKLLEAENFVVSIFKFLKSVTNRARRLRGCRGGTLRLVFSFSAEHDKTIVAIVAFMFFFYYLFICFLLFVTTFNKGLVIKLTLVTLVLQLALIELTCCFKLNVLFHQSASFLSQ